MGRSRPETLDVAVVRRRLGDGDQVDMGADAAGLAERAGGIVEDTSLQARQGIREELFHTNSFVEVTCILYTKRNKSQPLGDIEAWGRYLTKRPFSVIFLATMSQDKLIKLVSKGDSKGVVKDDVYYTLYNNKNKKDPSKKLSLKKYNKKLRKHVDYSQKK